MLKEDVVLSVVNLSKKFIHKGKSSTGKNAEVFWAVKDVNFNLKKGQIIGVIGHNGAGKSTLMKMLANVLVPTAGHIEYSGSILSILEIGTGFHPELSGYKNIFLNASILGMKKWQIAAKVDQIIEFSGIANHIHEPVKNYSSGMYLRLALSIALFTDNDILLLDEVLSVGDLEFRKKAMERVRAQTAEGKACIMISHDLGSIIEICDECLFIENGTVADSGEAKLMVEKYYEIFHDQIKKNYTAQLDHKLCRLLSVKLEKSAVKMNEPILIHLNYELKIPAELKFFLKVQSFHSQVMTASNAFNQTLTAKMLAPGIYQTTCSIPPNLFNAGTYIIDVIIGTETEVFIEWPDACRFKVLLPEWEKDKSWNSSLDLFAFRPLCGWTTSPIVDNYDQ